MTICTERQKTANCGLLSARSFRSSPFLASNSRQLVRASIETTTSPYEFRPIVGSAGLCFPYSGAAQRIAFRCCQHRRQSSLSRIGLQHACPAHFLFSASAMSPSLLSSLIQPHPRPMSITATFPGGMQQASVNNLGTIRRLLDAHLF